ncbi:Tetraspanin family [Popillia japonica]|uniref:Tetraspanin family n=1 Tax=Popillia japonica TaxID=7064 RepID=A0AAW1JEL0_POPJA
MIVQENVAKIIVIVCTTILTIIGVVSIIMAIVALNKRNKSLENPKLIKTLTLGQTIIPAVIIGTTGLAWVALWRRCKTLYLIYAIVMLLFGIGMLTICIMSFTMMESTIDKSKSDLVDRLKVHYSKYIEDNETRDKVDTMHNNFACCGPDKPIKIHNVYPISCCKILSDGKCLKPYQTGCADATITYTKQKVQCIGPVSFVFTLLLLCSGLAAVTVRQHIKKK